MNQPGFLAAAALVAFGTFGWGRALLAVLARIRPSEPDAFTAEITGPLVVAIGFAGVLAVAGVAVAIGVCRLPEIVAILGVGVLVALASGVRRLRRSGLIPPKISTLLVGASFTVVAFFSYGATLTGPINRNDDDPGYLYLAYRLLGTGGLIDPFNLRRITSYGGGEFFEALFVRSAGSGAALGTEWFVGVLLVTALVVRRSSRPYAWLVALVVGLALTIVHPVGIWANSAPTFTGLALTLAIFQLLAAGGRAGRSWRRDLVVGVLVGGLFALRFEFAIPVIVTVAVTMIFQSRRAAWRPIGVVAMGTVAAITGWAIALERSSKTVLFPLFAGNYNEAFPWEDPAFRTARQFLVRLWGEIETDGWGVEMIGVVVACGILFVVGMTWKRRDVVTPAIVVALGGTAGCALLMLSETRSLSGGVLPDIGRYNAPTALALVLFLADELWALASQLDTATSARDEYPTSQWRCRMPAAVCATMAAALVVIPIGAAFPFVSPSGSAIYAVSHATYNDGEFAVKRLDGAFGGYDRLAPFTPPYMAINRIVPRGSLVLTAVDFPGLLDFSRFDFSTLDIAGAVSPAPGIPLTEGGVAVRQYLQHLGYDGIVASVTNAPGLDNYRDWEANVSSGIEDYRAMATEFIAWAHVLSQLAHDPAVHRVRTGTIEYLSWSKS